MITGRVNGDLEAVVEIAVRGPAGRRTVEAVIGTGFNGWLSLPRKLISELKLRWYDTARATLADDSEVLVDVYDAAIEWLGGVFDAYVDAGSETPLIGMSLLRGAELCISVVEDGRVSIEPSA